MGQFNRDRQSGNTGSNRGFTAGARFNDRRERPQMHPATCTNCGNACEVPFKPTGDKPVLCRNCFRTSPGPDRRFASQPSRNFDKPRFEERPPTTPQYKEQLDSLNRKLDKILSILTAPTEQVPTQEIKEAPYALEASPITPTTPSTKKKKTSKKK